MGASGVSALLIASLVGNYLFVAFVTLLVICDYNLSDDSIAFLTLLWPIGVPMLLVHRLVRR